MDTQDSPVALPPLSESEYVYNMTHCRRGKAIIINNRKFLLHTNMGERRGTDEDAKNLQAVYEHLGFEVTRHDDVTVMNMLKILNILAK